MAVAILGARPNSHPFQERKVALKEPAKIGRAVAKCKSSASNLIFDCKVLSRSHAVIWYEDGKFFIQDTKSSNGTYVNNEQVGRVTEDPAEIEIKSGDILQFGVDVTENSKKVTHGCIIATATLLHPDGTEALREPENQTSRILPLIDEKDLKAQELWQLTKCLQEALNREQMLEQKLATLQRLIANASTASQDTLQAFIQEDELLSRLDILENELDIMTKETNEDNSKKLLISLEEEKECYEKQAKETIQRMLQEKLNALEKLADVQRSLSYSEDECSHMKVLNEKMESDVKDLMERHEQRLKELRALQEKLDAAMKWEIVNAEQVEEQRQKMKLDLNQAEKRGSALAVQVESLQAECDFTKKQLTSVKEKLEKSQLSAEKVEESSFAPVDDTVEPSKKLELFTHLRDTLNRISNCTDHIVKSLAASGYNLSDMPLSSHPLNGEMEDGNNLPADSVFHKGDEVIDKEICCQYVVTICCKEANFVEEKLKQLSAACETHEFGNEFTKTESKSGVPDLQSEIFQLNEAITKEQDTCKKYKEIAERFQVNFAAEESKRQLLKRELHVLCRRLEELQKHIDFEKSQRADDYLVVNHETTSPEEEVSTLQKENSKLNEKILFLQSELKKMKEGKLDNELDQLDSENNDPLEMLQQSTNELQVVSDIEIAELQKTIKVSSAAEVQATRQFQILAALIIIFIAIGAAVLLDVLNLRLGNSPILNPRTWKDIYENLF